MYVHVEGITWYSNEIDYWNSFFNVSRNNSD